MLNLKEINTKGVLEPISLEREISLYDCWDKISNYIFTPQYPYIEYEKNNTSTIPKLCIFKDFGYIYANFKKLYHIDLIKDNITYVEFLFLMQDLNLINEKNNTLKTLELFRTPVTDKECNNNREYKQFRINMMHTFSLETEEDLKREFNKKIKFPSLRKKEVSN